MVGNVANFSKIDVLRCFLRLGNSMGRQELASDLNLGEGTIRTILKILKSKKLLKSNNKGHHLSSKGSASLDELFNHISMPKAAVLKELYPEFKKIGLVVRHATELKSAYRLRDIAVKNGAEGALILLKQKNKIHAPESGFDANYNVLESQFDIKEGDIIIIACADSIRNAENGALGIAAAIDTALKKFINGL